MIQRRSYKYRIYPTKSQISNLENQFSMCRHLYNWNLEERDRGYKENGKSIGLYDQNKKLKFLKAGKPWYTGVHTGVLYNVNSRVDKAFKDFFRRVKDGETPGHPKFKKRGDWDSITYPSIPQKSLPRKDSKTIEVSKVGHVKIQYHRTLQGKPKTMTLKKESGNKWFVIFSVEQEFEIPTEPKIEPKKYLGLDLGLIHFYYGSDGSKVEAPKFLRKKEKSLKKLQRRFSKAKKRSERWYKLKRALQKLHWRIRNQRLDFFHKTVNNLLKRADGFFLEGLTIKNMVRRPKPKQGENGEYLKNGASFKSGLNKSINDAGWYRFYQTLEYKAESLGKLVHRVNPAYTSQKCSNCSSTIKKSLSTRTHVCKNCGAILDRDFNASRNILRLGLQSLGENP